jgi:hypothetical protein
MDILVAAEHREMAVEGKDCRIPAVKENMDLVDIPVSVEREVDTAGLLLLHIDSDPVAQDRE